MKKLLLIWLLVQISTASYAEDWSRFYIEPSDPKAEVWAEFKIDSSVEVWACQAIASAGLEWENDRWGKRPFMEENLIVLLDGDASSIIKGGIITEFTCESDSERFTSCGSKDMFAAQRFALNRELGQGGYSNLMGSVVDRPLQSSNSIYVTDLECRKFN